VPRTIDKLRAKLPGGKIGGYTIRGMSTALPGLSLVLLDGIGVSEGRLLEVVAGASVEDEVAQWLRQNANLSQTESLNSKLQGRRIEDVGKKEAAVHFSNNESSIRKSHVMRSGAGGSHGFPRAKSG
jgi:hypothetical protein